MNPTTSVLEAEPSTGEIEIIHDSVMSEDRYAL